MAVEPNTNFLNNSIKLQLLITAAYLSPCKDIGNGG
jgi:hypothetical protein